MTATLTPGDALVVVMMTTSAADQRLTDSELLTITRLVQVLPAFRGYDIGRIRNVTGVVYELLDADDGLDAVIGLVREALPADLSETAYALACDVAAADGKVPMAEMRWLEMLSVGLGLSHLSAAAIEHGARARHQPMPPQ